MATNDNYPKYLWKEDRDERRGREGRCLLSVSDRDQCMEHPSMI